MARKGQFITLEALDGAGKTTALQGLVSHLEARGIEVVTTREPGGTPYSEAIRDMLLNPVEQEPLADDAELLLIFAARAQHLERVINPALARGAWVVCDRFTDSTYAYQGGGRQGDLLRIAQLEAFTQRGQHPDLTFLLDLPESAAKERRQQRAGACGAAPADDRIEQESSAFFHRVREAYLDRADQAIERTVIIDATQSITGVQHDISDSLNAFLDRHPAPHAEPAVDHSAPAASAIEPPAF